MAQLIGFCTAFVFLSLLSPNNRQTVSYGGMKVSWEVKGSLLEVEMQAPTRGWLAIGFNERNELSGTHLIMGAVRGEAVELSDRYIRQPGQHEAIERLGGTPVLRLGEGEEDAAGTRIRFTLPLAAADRWHKNLVPGQQLFLLVAFSREDDFFHHSMMRTTLSITL